MLTRPTNCNSRSAPTTRVCRYKIRPSGSGTHVAYERNLWRVGYLLALGHAPSCSTLSLVKRVTGRTYALRSVDMRSIASPMLHGLRSTPRAELHATGTR